MKIHKSNGKVGYVEVEVQDDIHDVVAEAEKRGLIFEMGNRRIIQMRFPGTVGPIAFDVSCLDSDSFHAQKLMYAS